MIFTSFSLFLTVLELFLDDDAARFFAPRGRRLGQRSNL